MAPRTSIIDTHIHLFPASEIDQLAWQTPNGPLRSQHSLEEYLQDVSDTADIDQVRSSIHQESTHQQRTSDTTGKPILRGFVFIETDRKSGLDPSCWNCPLNEIRYLSRIALGRPRDGEGHRAEHAHLCKGIVPWIPLPAGAEAMAEYRRLAHDAAGGSSDLIKGWRYLVQDKEYGIMLKEPFVDGLRAIARWGEVLELGVDYHRRGNQQVLEAIRCLRKVYDGLEDGIELRIVINHMCKPRMYERSVDSLWEDSIKRLASFPAAYMKLSGGFSEISPLPPKSAVQERAIAYGQAVQSIYDHMDIVWEAFGPDRCMFGSDWPVCKVGLGDQAKEEPRAWQRWLDVARAWADRRQLNESEQTRFFADVAARVYKIDPVV